MAKLSYFEKRKNLSIDNLNLIVDKLPYFCQSFFIGIENLTSPLTRLNYGYDLKIFFEYLEKRVFRHKKVTDIELSDLAKLEAEDIELFLSYLSHYKSDEKEKTCSASAKARKLSTLRAFFKYFYNKNQLPRNIATKVSMPKIHEKEIIRLDSNEKINEIADMLSVVKNGDGLTEKQRIFHESTKIRDTAIVTLFLGTGIRVSELVGLNIDDIDFNTNSFVVTRKGGNRAVLYFNNDVANALSFYMLNRNENNLIATDEKALFVSLQNRRISTRAIQELVKKYARIISPLKKITPHKLRSTFGTNLYRQTGDIYVVADCLGHKDVNTTKKHYAAITEDVRKKAGLNLDITNKQD